MVMKKPYFIFFAKVLLFIIVAVFVDYAFGFIFRHFREKSFEKNPLSYELICDYCIKKATPDIAIIGSSTASHHYIPSILEDSLNVNVYNFGVDGGFFYFQNTLINLMVERWKPMCIIWEIGESSLSDDYDENREYQKIGDFYPWYNNVYVHDIVDRKDSYQSLRMLSNCYINNSKLLTYVRLCRGDYNHHEKGYYPLFTTNNPIKVEKKVENAEIVPYKEQLLEKTIKRCNDLGIKIIFTSSPRFYSDNIKTTNCYKRILAIADRNDIPFIDFYDSEPFCDEPTLFSDNDHMNDKGTSLYMTKFIPELKKVLIHN